MKPYRKTFLFAECGLRCKVFVKVFRDVIVSGSYEPVYAEAVATAKNRHGRTFEQILLANAVSIFEHLGLTGNPESIARFMVEAVKYNVHKNIEKLEGKQKCLD